MFAAQAYRSDRELQADPDMAPSSSPRLFCFGLGYVGSALAAALAADGWRVAPPPPVPTQAAEHAPGAHRSHEGSRRVRNERIKRELGVTLRYPDYRQGLAACLTAAR